MLTNTQFFRKNEAFQKRALRFMIKSYESTCKDPLNKLGSEI